MVANRTIQTFRQSNKGKTSAPESPKSVETVFFNKMSPIEEWFDILKNMNTFVSKPAHVNQRFNGILEACRQTQLPDVEHMQYVRAMISDREKQDIEEAALERGFEQGVKQGLEQGVKQGLEQGIEQEKILTVKRLLAVKAEMQTIVAATGLTEEQIKEIA